MRTSSLKLALMGVSVGQAQSETDLLFPQFYAVHKHPEYGKPYTGQLTGLKEYVSGKLRRSLIVLWCAVGLILLIVCVNSLEPSPARAAARSKEFAMRRALEQDAAGSCINCSRRASSWQSSEQC